MMNAQPRTEAQPRRLPMPEWNADKGRKHEAFENASLGCERRSRARSQAVDRKR